MNMRILLVIAGLGFAMAAFAEPAPEEESELLQTSRRGGSVQQELPKNQRPKTQEGGERKAQARIRVLNVDHEQRRTGIRKSSQIVVPESPSRKRQKGTLSLDRDGGEVGTDLQRSLDEIRKTRIKAQFRSLYKLKKKQLEPPMMEIQPW